MSKWEVELDSEGIQELLKSPEIEVECLRVITGIRSACGSGYEVTTYIGKTRVNAMIEAKTASAKAREAKFHTLQNALKAVKE